MADYATWQTWSPPSGALVINFPSGIYINSLYIPVYYSTISVYANNTAVALIPPYGPTMVPLPVGTTTVELMTPNTSPNINVFATSAVFNPLAGGGNGTIGGGVLTFGSPNSIGANNANTAIVGRAPLALPTQIVAVAAIGNVITSGSKFNIAVGEVAMNGTVTPTGGNPIAGNQMFAVDQALPPAGIVATYPAPTLPVYSAGLELTLRVSTPSGGGIDALTVLAMGALL